jgi:hypothetical protein
MTIVADDAEESRIRDSVGGAEARPDLLGEDLLYGARAIAGFLGLPMRRCFYLLEQRRVPCGKLGGLWIASKSALREHMRRIARGETP